MKRTDYDGIIAIEDFEVHGSLAAAANSETLDQLISLAERFALGEVDRPHDQAVVLVQKSAAQDLSLPFIKKLADQVLLDDLTQRFMRVRYLLVLIRDAKVPWIYCAGADVFDGFFELACCCHRFFCFNLSSQVGLPSLMGGAFPFAGMFQSWLRRDERTLEQWLNQPILSVNEGLERGLVNVAIEHSGWVDHVGQFALDRLAMLPRIPLVRSPDFPEQLEAFRRVDTLVKPLSEIPTLADAASKPKAGGVSSLDLVPKIMKVRGKEIGKPQKNQLIALSCAQYALSKPYLLWAERFRQTTSARPWVAAFQDPYRVALRLDGELPPIAVVISLLGKKAYLLFSCREKDVLKRKLEHVFGQLERTLDFRSVQELWRRVSWTVGERGHWPELEFDKIGNLRLAVPGLRLVRSYRLAGNRAKAISGFIEVQQGVEKTDPLLTHILDMTSEGILWTTTGQVAPLVRAIALRELYAVAITLEGGWGRLLSALGERDWGFLAMEEAWEDFIEGLSSFDLPAALTSAQPKSLKHLRNEIKNQSQQRIGHWNPTTLSLHFQVMAGLIAQRLSELRLVDGERTADNLVSEALGFPKEAGTPQAFGQVFGEARLAYYKKTSEDRGFFTTIQAF